MYNIDIECIKNKNANLVIVRQLNINETTLSEPCYECHCSCSEHECKLYATQSELCNSKFNLCRRCTYVQKAQNKYPDLKGKIFGRLTVLDVLYIYPYKNNRSDTMCKCQCECGNTVYLVPAILLGGRQHSCGCLEKESRYERKHNLMLYPGQRFGHLQVLSLSSTKKDANNNCFWHCKCDCGNYCDVAYHALISGHTRSCGCNKQSKYEEFASKILLHLHIQNQREYSYNDLLGTDGKSVLRFDFHFLYKGQEYCLECQGQQHYEIVKGWGGEMGFKKRNILDEKKRQYCQDNGIILICVPYYYTHSQAYHLIKDTLNIHYPLTSIV